MVSADQYTVSKLKNGDTQSFIVLYKKYYTALHYFSFRYLKSKEDAEEIVQNLFLKIWERRENIDDTLNFKSYLYQIAVNDILNFIKKRNNEKKYMSQISASGFISADEFRYDYSDLLEHIDRHVDGFPPQRKLIFTLNRFEGLSYNEIALNLNLSVRTIENQVFRSVKSIREHVGHKKALCA